VSLDLVKAIARQLEFDLGYYLYDFINQWGRLLLYVSGKWCNPAFSAKHRNICIVMLYLLCKVKSLKKLVVSLLFIDPDWGYSVKYFLKRFRKAI
jgi:hypothetical protein